MNQRSRGLIPDLDRRLATQRVLLEAVRHVVRDVPVRIVTDFDQIPTLLVIGIFDVSRQISCFCAWNNWRVRWVFLTSPLPYGLAKYKK